MRQIPRAELLDAMQKCLRDLENTELLSPDDLDIIDQKRTLRQQIAGLREGKRSRDRSPIIYAVNPV